MPAATDGTDAPWLVVVLAAVCTGLHIWDLPAGIAFEITSVSAFSLLGGAIPATLFRIAVDLAPPAGSAPATIGLMQQIFNAGSVAGPAIAAWLVTRTGGWQSTWWITCAFAMLGSLLSLHLSGPLLGTACGARSATRSSPVNGPVAAEAPSGAG